MAGAHVLQRRQHLDDDAARLGLFERAALLEVLLQIGARAELENGGKGVAADDEAVELANHVFVADALERISREERKEGEGGMGRMKGAKQ